MSNEDRKQELQDVNKDRLQEIADKRGVEDASSMKKEDLVQELSKEEHAESSEVAEAVEEKVQIEYVGDFDIWPPGVIAAFLSDDQLSRQMTAGDQFEMPKSLSKGVLANANFKPAGSAAEKVQAELEAESRQATYDARAALAAPGSLERHDQGGVR
jgi:transcription termination factor Rho